MLGKTLARRTRKVRSVVGAIEVFREKVAGTLVDRLAPYVEEGEDLGAAVDLVHRVLQRLIRDQSHELGSAHELHQAQQAVIQTPRQRRDRAASDLRAALVSVREAASVEFGRQAGRRLLGVKGRTAHVRQVDLLIFQTHDALKGLERARVKLPPSRPRALPSTGRERFRSGEWIAALREPLARLERAQEDLILQQNEKLSAGGDVRDTAAEQDATLVSVKKVVEGFHELAGKDILKTHPLFPRRRKRRQAKPAAAAKGSAAPAKPAETERPPLRVVASGKKEPA